MNHKSRKGLSAEALLSAAKDIVKKFPEQIKGNRPNPITLADCIMSAIALFGMKYSSLLSFDNALNDDTIIIHNLKTLYFVKNAPSDTYMRERLDEADPFKLRKLFTMVFSRLQRGKALENYAYIDGHYIISLDGTCFFNSNAVSCENCCTKEHKDGSISYYHNILVGAVVHPSMKTVIPLSPEIILKKDGHVKNGSEHEAAKRFIQNLQREHPHLKAIIVGDSLHSKGPFIRKLQSGGYKYILNAKPGDHKTLFGFANGVCINYTIKKGGTTYQYRYVNGIPLSDAHQDIPVNFLECIETNAKGSKTFTWVTNIEITETNIHQIMQGGRARWKIENETFNTLKNQGYQFEHNFGHGKKNLSTVFAMLMVCAFLIDQTQELCDALFQAALKKEGKRSYLWKKMQSLFFEFFINSWEELWRAIAQGYKRHVLQSNTS